VGSGDVAGEAEAALRGQPCDVDVRGKRNGFLWLTEIDGHGHAGEGDVG
jgi:hypothetical protein